MTVIQKTLFLAAGQPKKCLVWKGHNTMFSQYSCFLYIFSRILGAYIWTIRESVRFASERSRVRVSSGPPNKYWTNTYFFSGGFAVKCSLWSTTEKRRLGSDPETALFLYFCSGLKLYIYIPSMLRRGVLWWLSCTWSSKKVYCGIPSFSNSI